MSGISGCFDGLVAGPLFWLDFRRRRVGFARPRLVVATIGSRPLLPLVFLLRVGRLEESVEGVEAELDPWPACEVRESDERAATLSTDGPEVWCKGCNLSALLVPVG